MSIVRRCRSGLSGGLLALGAVAALALSVLAIVGVSPAQVQTTDQTTAGTDEAIPAPAPSIFPTPTATSQTCMFGCSTQVLTCQNSCISTLNGTTINPSMTTVGTTTNPTTCQSNCSTQLTVCQRNCNLGP